MVRVSSLQQLQKIRSYGIYLIICAFSLLSCDSERSRYQILIPEDATFQEQLAAKEVRRYLYVSTDALLPIRKITNENIRNNGSIVISGLYNYQKLKSDRWLQDNRINEISEQGYLLRKYLNEGNSQFWIIGGEHNGILYGAYKFLEAFGLGFYLHDDVIPEEKKVLELPDLDIKRNPLFNLRGILPFHDFPEGPDWWSLEDYKAVIGQLPKMGMNFIGFHTYPESDSDRAYRAEPIVWIGPAGNISEDGAVNSGYPVLHFNTGDNAWGYLSRNTSSYFYGADKLFDKEQYGTDYIHDLSPWPHTMEENIRVFNESGRFYASAFSYAKLMGVKTCVGTESYLTIPAELSNTYFSNGLNQAQQAIVKSLYRGMFERIKRTYPLDYYWLWTPESWTWNEVPETDIDRVKNDILIADEALQEAGSPFQLATCGWVLGPPNDRAGFDKMLPKSMPFSCINREVGFSPVEPAFGEISERPLWAIPWLEDDPALISPQLWVGRMRKDALDAYRYGCEGLMGIHWRTINVAPMASALSKAAWELGEWIEKPRGSRDLDPLDFYRGWAAIQFGEMYADDIAQIFANIDGGPLYITGEGSRISNLYRTSDWIGGPGGIRKIGQSEEELENRFGFIDDLELLETEIRGTENKERLRYWINTFRYAEKTAILGNTLYELDSLMHHLNDLQVAERIDYTRSEILPKRIQVNKDWKEMTTRLLMAVNTKGEMGTVANLQQHNMDFLNLLFKYDDQIRNITGTDLPHAAMPDRIYSGSDRLIVPTRRTNLEKGEDFNLKIIVLTDRKVNDAVLYWKKLGDRKFQKEFFKFEHPNHAAITLNSTAVSEDDFEYYVSVRFWNGGNLTFPSSAPALNRTVVISPE